MADLHFDPSVTPDENIRRFFDHLKTVDEGLARVLEEDIVALIPLPESAQRAKAREAFYKSVRPKIEPKSPDKQESE